MPDQIFTRNEPQTRDLVTRAITVRAESVNTEERSVEAVLSTDARALVYDMRRGQIIEEILLASGAEFGHQVPMLENHYRYSVRDVLGSIRDIRVDGKQLLGRLIFAEGDESSEAAWNKVRQGHLTDVSIGYRATEFIDIQPNTTQTVRGKSYTAGQYTLRITTKYTLREGSLVPIGADQAAKIRAEAGIPPQHERVVMDKLRKYLATLGLRADATDEQVATFRAMLGDDQQRMANGIEDGSIVWEPPTQKRSEEAPKPPVVPIDQDALRREAAQAEQKRIAAINDAARGDVPDDLRNKAIAENWTVERASMEFLKSIREQSTPPVSGAPAQHNRSHERDCTEQALAFGLALRCGVNPINPRAPEAQRRQQEQFAEQGERFQTWALADLCREALRLDGREVPYDRYEMIRAATSTGSLSNMFTTSINARLLQSYQEAPDTTDGWVRETDVNNFQTQDRITGGKTGGLNRLARGKTAEHGSVSDEIESYKIFRYAQQMVIDEQDIIDENLSFFTTLPMEMGMAAARLRPDLVYSILLANATLNSTSRALFNTTDANYGTTSTALAIGTLKAAVTAMAKQTATDSNGKAVNLNLSPRFLMVPQDLVFTARELVRSTQIIIAGDTDTERGNANTLADLDLQIRSDNRLGVSGVTDPVTGSSYAGTATNWFLAADPVAGRTIEVGYLAGTGRRPMVRRFVLDRGQYGIGFDIKLDIGAKALSPKGLYKATGAS